ncbi:MAG: LmbE family N-acetylglucosaminyl deacetylase [Candidatus Azotimanducaceae bacterium]|jgi:LmbE family N-acetylglucosaminyl deacetylase
MNVLAIGAHPDDIEIGCGGALLKHIADGDTVTILILTGGGRGGDAITGDLSDIRCNEAVAAANILGVKLECWAYQDTEIPEGFELIQKIEKVVGTLKPDRVYVPYGMDTHQDHRITSNASKSACRKVKQILEYEGPSSYNSFNATYWVDISDHIDKKLESIKVHESQGEKQILKIKSIEGLNLYRGYQSHVEHAEGFVTFKFLEQ